MNLKDAGIYDMINIFKGEATKAHGASQGGVINNKPRLINIPAYQRPYRWKTDRIVRLFYDYDENNEEYFLGSVVVVEKKKNDGNAESYYMSDDIEKKTEGCKRIYRQFYDT